MLIPTGVSKLDRMLGGGIPEGFLLSVRGKPGSGETLFCTKVALTCAKHGIKPLYVSFLEDRAKYISTVSALLPEMADSVHKGEVSYLEFSSTVEKGVGPILESLFAQIQDVDPKLVVIDSFSALENAVGTLGESRSIVSNMFSRILAKKGVSTLMISEGDKDDFTSFVADGILRFGKRSYGNLVLRELEVSKMRSVSLGHNRFVYTFERGYGIRVFEPFVVHYSERVRSKKPLPDGVSRYSAGSKDLDSVTGGYPRGSLVFWDIGESVPLDALYATVAAPLANFILQDRGVMILPTLEFMKEDVRRFLYPDERTFAKCVRMFVYSPAQADYFVQLTGVAERDLITWDHVYESFGGKPVIKVAGLDALEHVYGREKAIDMIRGARRKTSESGDVTLIVSKPGLFTAETVRNMANVRLSLRFVDGYIVFGGLSPYTGNYLFEASFSRGYPQLFLRRLN